MSTTKIVLWIVAAFVVYKMFLEKKEPVIPTSSTPIYSPEQLKMQAAGSAAGWLAANER